MLAEDMSKPEARRLIRIFGFSFMMNCLLVALGGLVEFSLCLWVALLGVAVVLFSYTIKKPTDDKQECNESNYSK